MTVSARLPGRVQQGKQHLPQGGLLGWGQRGEQVALDLGPDGGQVAHHPPSLSRQVQHAAAAVSRVNLPANQALGGQGVDNRHGIARVDADQLGQVLLAERAGLAKGRTGWGSP